MYVCIFVFPQQSGRPANTVVQSSSTGGIWGLLGTVLYPLLAVWRFLSGFIFSSPPPGAAAAPRNQPQRPSNSSNANSGEPKRWASSANKIFLFPCPKRMLKSFTDLDSNLSPFPEKRSASGSLRSDRKTLKKTVKSTG